MAMVLLTSILSAQVQTGSIKGKIADIKGFPLPGAFIYFDSPIMLNHKTFITSETGTYKFRGLPPGKYKLIVEMPGFKSVKIENIDIHAGLTITLDVTLEMTTIEEEVSKIVSTPTLDAGASKTAHIIDEDLINRIPFQRDLHHVYNAVSGVLPKRGSQPNTSLIHSSPESNGIYFIDGVPIHDPMGSNILPHINFDITKEIEIETAGHPAAISNTDSGYINIITKAGDNALDGSLFFYHTNDSLKSQLIPQEELNALDVTPPPLDKSLWDLSFSLNGAFMSDIVRFYTNFHLFRHTKASSFAPWTDPLGINHSEYDWQRTSKSGFLKLTSQFIPQFKVVASFSYASHKFPAENFLTNRNLTEEATTIYDPEKNFRMTGVLNYIIDQNTFVDVTASYQLNNITRLVQEQGRDKPQYFDEVSGHIWGSAALNRKQKEENLRANVSLVHFQDRILGSDHLLKVGGEYESNSSRWDVWKADNLLVHYYNGSPYYFGQAESPDTGNMVGKGKVSFYLASKNELGFIPNIEMKRLSAYVQDSATFGDRVTLNLGLRFDRSVSTHRDLLKLASGNPISLQLGEDFILPVIGVNPYSDLNFPRWNKQIAWNSFSPRLGLSFDVFGNGKTIFKASFSRYPEYLRMASIRSLSPFYYNKSHQFFWYDENMDEQVDANDSFAPFPYDFRQYGIDYFEKIVDSKLKAPYTNEFTIGLSNELFNNFSIKINYIYKHKKNLLQNVLYDLDQNQEWYTINRDNQGWWIPFNTTVPAIDDYQQSPLTLYYRSNEAPLLFYQLSNVPELEQKYQAVELGFNKRMSHNWQLHGSVVFSRATGNPITELNIFTQRLTSTGINPNSFVNVAEDSKLISDIPMAIKLMGTYNFPYDFYVSFYYSHISGTIWTRNLAIIPPDSWSQEENINNLPEYVYLENPGSRRNESYNNLDIRAEKEFSLENFGRLSVFLDIYNALGNKYHLIDKNDGGYWYPDDENISEGIRIANPMYKKGTTLTGIRGFSLSFRLSF